MLAFTSGDACEREDFVLNVRVDGFEHTVTFVTKESITCRYFKIK